MKKTLVAISLAAFGFASVAHADGPAPAPAPAKKLPTTVAPSKSGGKQPSGGSSAPTAP